MKSHVYTLLLLMCTTIVSCKDDQHSGSGKKQETGDKLKLADWLIGKWENRVGDVLVTEIWEKGEDTYFGKSYSIRNSDTVSSERIQLKNEGDKLVYLPIVKNQNADEVVKFTLTSFTEKQLIFENPEHDFPQKISYTLITNDSLLAEISGLYKGKLASEKFPMHRMN
jgi:hypothetical protein